MKTDEKKEKKRSGSRNKPRVVVHSVKRYGVYSYNDTMTDMRRGRRAFYAKTDSERPRECDTGGEGRGEIFVRDYREKKNTIIIE